MNLIKYVELGSIAESLDIEPGDELIGINGTPVVDIMDYMFLADDADIEVEILKPDGETWILEIEKEYGEPLGLVFENPIIDSAKRCSNQCVFCFIDQLPKGMRETLYFKDDDSRLSFLQGNFVTLTNLKDADIDRIIRYRISPINVSVHTTDPDLRIKMLGNRFAGNIVERLKRLTEGGIVVHAQIVMCPGYNDGKYLDETLETLFEMYPGIQTAAIVPIGLTRHRGGLIEMQPVTQVIAEDTISRVHAFQKKALKQSGTRFAFLADEFYLQAKAEMPPDEAYEGYLQFEDGVGMIRKLATEMEALLKHPPKADKKRRIAIVTGTAAYESMCELTESVSTHYPQVDIRVFPVINRFFGERITVVGLLTAQDMMEQIPEAKDYDALLLADSVFRAEDDVTLDDVTLEALIDYYGIPVYRVKVNARDLLNHILYGGKNE